MYRCGKHAFAVHIGNIDIFPSHCTFHLHNIQTVWVIRLGTTQCLRSIFDRAQFNILTFTEPTVRLWKLKLISTKCKRATYCFQISFPTKLQPVIWILNIKELSHLLNIIIFRFQGLLHPPHISVFVCSWILTKCPCNLLVFPLFLFFIWTVVINIFTAILFLA